MAATIKRLSGIVSYAGVTIAFFIGSGFATAQEIMQYFVSYDIRFPVVILVSMAIFIYTNWSFIHAGTVCGMKKPRDIYSYYGGKKIGAFYDIFAIIFIFLSYVVMCGGAGAAMEQQFQLPRLFGTFLLAVPVMTTVVFGLNGLVKVLGKIGPVIIFLIIMVGAYSVVTGADRIEGNIRLLQSCAVQVIRVGNHPVSSAVSYAGFVMLWFCTFMAELGAKNGSKDVCRGMLLGAAAIAVCLAVVSLGLIANIESVANAEIPSAVLAAQISPLFAQFFSGIILCGSYTAATPLLWTVSNRFFQEGTPQFRAATVVLGLTGVLIALILPYKKLVNIIYGINGYVGIALIFFMLQRDVRTFILTKKKHSGPGLHSRGF